MCSLLQGWRGREFFGAGSWWYLYKLPIEKRTADLQWTNRYRVHLDPELGEGCIFCSQAETLAHLFAQCPHLDILFELLKT